MTSAPAHDRSVLRDRTDRTTPTPEDRPAPQDGDSTPVPLVLHWGGPRHGEVDDVPAERRASSVLVYDGPRWFGVYQRFEPVRVQATSRGPAEVWVVRE